MIENLHISFKSDIQVALNSFIEFQGDKVLELIRIEKKFAQFRLIGFSRPEIFICDFRMYSLKALKNSMKSHEYDEFLDQFSKPALLNIRQQSSNNVIVELRDAKINKPDYMFWVAIGIDKNEIPDYCFIMREEVAVKKKKALFSIYLRPRS